MMRGAVFPLLFCQRNEEPISGEAAR